MATQQSREDLMLQLLASNNELLERGAVTLLEDIKRNSTGRSPSDTEARMKEGAVSARAPGVA